MSDDVVSIRRLLGPTLKYANGRIDVVNPGGPAESSLPDGGSTGQVLTKASSADQDATWQDIPDAGSGLPAGGTTGQYLVKDSSADGDAGWQDLPDFPDGLPAGGVAGQILTKDSGTDGDASWQDLPAADGLPAGGTTGQVLTKDSSTDGDASWQDPDVVSIPAYLKTYVDAPASPSAFDFDASKATDPDLANNGFLVHLFDTPYTTVTRVGPVDPFNPSAPVANTYRSSLIGGLLYMQVAAGQVLSISKQFDTAAAGHTLKVHAWVTKQTANGTFTSFADAFIMGGLASPSGKARYSDSGVQSVFVGVQDSKYQQSTDIAGSFPTVVQTVNITVAQSDQINYIHCAQTSGGSQVIKVLSGSPMSFLQPGTPNSGSITVAVQRAGVRVACTTTGMVVIDCIRQLPYLTFP